MTKAAYVPPKVWKDEAGSGGQFSKINRPIAGSTHDKVLPVGKHPLQLYSLATPNGVKVTIMLEELLALGKTDAEYDAWLIRIGEGDQFSSGLSRSTLTPRFPRCSIAVSSRLFACSSPARSCCIWRKNSAPCCRPILRVAPKP